MKKDKPRYNIPCSVCGKPVEDFKAKTIPINGKMEFVCDDCAKKKEVNT